MILYDLSIFLFSIFSLPKAFKKYRKTFLEKLGLRLPKASKGCIWIHAVSVGEVKASITLIQELKKRAPHQKIYLSTVTETGLKTAKQSNAIDHVFILPIDFSITMRRLIKRLSPSILILVEGDFWYNMLRFSKKAKIPILCVSGKISERSLRRFKKVPFLPKALFNKVDHFCTQNEIYSKRFTELGISKSKVQTCGNLKYDQKAYFLSDEDVISWKKTFNLQQPFITIASSHHPEEKQIIQQIIDLPIKIAIAPRHPQRFDSVAMLLQSMHIPFVRYSEIEKHTDEKVILIDTMGFLPICYQLSKLTIVAGSFTDKVGGHNVLEPCLYYCPVLFGLYMWSQQELKELVLDAKAGRQISLSNLRSTLQLLLKENNEELHAMTNHAKNLSSSLGGKVTKTLNAISLYYPLEKN